ncbi:MAG: DnaJ domain-containing protein [Alphaproteobacteria bacterium]|nr:DnaJ domain-containing protein [Alphaproteobacteria bacterium]
MQDPYRALGVQRGADAETIRKAFKKLARKYHPDVSKEPDAEERFKEVNAAYGILGDPEKRKAFDEFGEASTRPGFDAAKARQWRGMGGMGGSTGGGFEFDGNMDDLLQSIFRGGGVGSEVRERKGPDLKASFTIDFLTAVTGGEREISVPQPDGRAERLKVRIPPGVSNGGRLKIRGQGLPPRGGGACGDLNLELTVRDHPILRRLGDDDLEMDLPLTIYEAMAGASIVVPTPTGDVKVNVPAGAKPGQRLRLKGRGIQKRVPGHLYLVLQPTPPTSDDPDVLLAAKRLEEAYVGDLRGGLEL